MDNQGLNDIETNAGEHVNRSQCQGVNIDNSVLYQVHYRIWSVHIRIYVGRIFMK